MAERSHITQVVQLGMEVTPGTSVAATKRLQSLDFETKVMTNVDKFRPAGFKLNTVSAQEREWTEATVKGQPTYTEVLYPFASVISTTGMGPATISDGGVDTLARKWTFEMNDSAPDVPQTFTLEQGSSVRAHKYSAVQFKEFTWKFTREKQEIGGAILGQLLTDNATLSGGTTSPALVPVLAKQVSVYLDATSGGLGTTKMPRLFSGDFTLNNRFGPVWVVDAAQPSWVATVETVPTATFKAIVEADANGMALLNNLRSSATYFMRVDCVGQQLWAGPRVDAGSGTTSGSPTVTDASVTAADLHRPVTGAGIPANSFVGVVTPGVSFGLSSSSSVNTAVNATATATVAVTIGTTAAVNYEWRQDMAVEVTNIEPFSDQQGVYAVGFEFTLVHDAGWGKGLHVEVTNLQTAL